MQHVFDLPEHDQAALMKELSRLMSDFATRAEAEKDAEPISVLLMSVAAVSNVLLRGGVPEYLIRAAFEGALISGREMLDASQLN